MEAPPATGDAAKASGEDLAMPPLLESPLVRAPLALLLAFFLGTLLGPRIVAALRRRKIGDIAEKGDSGELDAMSRGKRGTPTMGGVIIVLCAGAAAFVCAEATLPAVLTGITALALGSLGAIDDWAKLHTKGKGISARAKMVGIAAAGALLGVTLYAADGGFSPRAGAERLPSLSIVRATGGVPEAAPQSAAPDVARPVGARVAGAVRVPFTGGRSVTIGLLWIALVMLVVAGTANGVNFTDGLDGLAGGAAALTLFPLTLAALVAGDPRLAALAGTTHLPGAAEAGVVGAAVLGGTLAFLWFNAYPAQVFMGDTGSLALGGTIAALAVAARQELALVLAGLVFVLEGTSVLLQVGYFKLTKRRIFRCAPLHHHYQFSGMPETRITQRLWIVAALGALLGTGAMVL